jgi:predicted nucleotidyltransferase
VVSGQPELALAVHPMIQSHRPELAALCRRYGVSRLEIFGSAARPSSGEGVSDFDFLVEFEEREDGGYAGAYFGLLEALEDLLKKPVDLVVISAIDNPYFLEEIARSRSLVYGA